MKIPTTKLQQKLNHDQRGMVSILTVMILMIVITLITLGFSRLANREQNDVLDRQLSTQAFYSAESGVNDAISAIADGFEGDKENCDNWENENYAAGFPGAPSNQLSESVSYSCLLIDSTPNSLGFTGLDPNHSRSFPLQSADGTNITFVEITWQQSGFDGVHSSDGCTGSHPSFPRQVDWPAGGCHAPVLRVDIVPTGGSFTRDDLITKNFAFLLYPRSSDDLSSEIVNYSPSNSGVIVRSRCDGSGSYLCTTTITNLNSQNSDQFHMRIRPVYSAADFEIRAFGETGSTPPPESNPDCGVTIFPGMPEYDEECDLGGGSPTPDISSLDLTGAQIEIDSTGRAVDLLRRVVVRVSSGTFIGSDTPGFAVQSSTHICKVLLTEPGSTTSGDGMLCPLP